MSISLPTYSRLELPLLGRRERVRAIIATGLRREFRRPAAIVVTVLGAAFTTITSIVLLIFAQILIPGQAADLTFFALPASNGFVLFFVSLMAAVIGAGLIADDMQSMAFTLYMSRPITQTDYLLAKAAILAPLVAMVTILPLLLTALVAALLSRVSWAIAVEAMGISLVIGGLLTLFYTAVTLFLSSHLLPDVETICKYVVILDGGHQIAAGELSQLLTGATDRLRIDVRGDQAAFARLLKEAGFEADAGPTGLHVTRKPGLESAVFDTAKSLGAEVRYMGKEIRSLEELFLELVARTEKRGA